MFKNFLMENGEALQYMAFFGPLAILSLGEIFLPEDDREPRRKGRWLSNFALTLINILVLGALPLGAVGAALLAQEWGWGIMAAYAFDLVTAIIFAILLRSLISYGVHVLMHKVPVFWRLHRVHHLDRFLDISTTVRFHPLENFAAYPFQIGAILVFGLPPVAIALYEILDAAMAVFTHANIRIPPQWDRLLRWILVTPAMHRIHHSAYQPETDSNFGATFSIWDRLFKTYVNTSASGKPQMLGLEECQDRRAENVWWLMVSPFSRITRFKSDI